MRVRIWPFVSISFGIFLVLVMIFAWVVSRKASQIDSKSAEAHRVYKEADDEITELGADVYRTALILRDASQAASTPRELDAIHRSTAEHVRMLSGLLAPGENPLLRSLERSLNEYWASVERSLASAPERTGSELHLKNRNDERDKVLELARELDALNSANLRVEEQQIQMQQSTLRGYAVAATGLLLLLGAAVAVGSTAYLAKLERISEREMERAEQAEHELRRLSNQLVRVQEDERRTISRELHDEVGQILTGLRMELGSLWRGEGDGRFRDRLDSVKQLAEEALRAVRNLALLLRPSMLDDLGLGPALRWQAKETSRRSGIPVSVDIHGNLDGLPESFGICLYRAVQEALTNCIKHAEASRVSVTVTQDVDRVSACVHDNGKGFDPNGLRTEGLGLIGMEERIRVLGGKLSVSSELGEGTLVRVDLPLTAQNSPVSIT